MDKTSSVLQAHDSADDGEQFCVRARRSQINILRAIEQLRIGNL